MRLLQFAALTLAVTAVAWVFTDHLMSHYSVTSCACQPSTGLLAGGPQVTANLNQWWQSVAELANGAFYGLKVSLTSVLAVACAALSLIAVVLLPRIAWTEARPYASKATVDLPAVRLAFIVYWSTSAVFLTLAYLVSAAPVGEGLTSDRYLVGVIYAAAAVIPVISTRHVAARAVALAGTMIFGLTGVISMAEGTPYQQGLPSDAEINTVDRIATRDHLSIGYSGYWDASPITWATNFRLRVYPVNLCGPALCRFYLHYIANWYVPRSGIRSFLLADPALPAAVSPTPGLGRPSAVYHIDQITMYVFPYDLATKIGP